MGHLPLGRSLLALTLSAGILLAGTSPTAADPDEAAETEIAALLAAIGASNCTFFRNEAPGTAAEAKAHLERKYRYLRKKVESPETFIDRVASKSSVTGRPYLVECPGKPRQQARQWLLERLAEIRDAAANPIATKPGSVPHSPR
jgi:hypothetical protein